ncbi:histidine phosphatase family protein [Neobacillus piezotolerans]|uniref:Histidine phosphatase family protein n=1 Tax=Neobacillus piezotolerans TaxID=2259171 RepID=A0A3D8GRG4_9BACI|nr:histidine phosphatase family protein [Neobacillus piezotolerans]RDU36872.1 histidine phosphatase family protein [Neobacillus piezotolerans]
MRTTIYFVRHAHTEYTPDELGRPLSVRGKKDAERVAELLKNKNISVVLSSPYMRAVETVAGVAKAIGTEIKTIEGFRERLLSGQSVDDFSTAIQKVWKDEEFAWEGGESNKDAQARGVAALNHVLDIYKGETIAIGTHGNIMAIIMNHFSEEYGFEFWNNLEMPDIYKLSFEGLELAEVQRVWSRS